MDYFGLDDDERVIAETAAAFAEKRLAPYALEWDENHHFPTDVLREAAELGMAAIYCREDVGGSELRRLDAVRIFEQLAPQIPPSPRSCPSTTCARGWSTRSAPTNNASRGCRGWRRWRPSPLTA